MEHNVQLFEHEEFGSVRVVMIDGNPWFVGKDIAIALGYKEPEKAIREHIPDKFKGVSVLDTPGGKQKVVVISEAGMYRLVFRSKLPVAEKFTDWVCEEVLLSIRKTGTYSVVSVDPLAIEREKLALEREKFNVENSEETKLFKRAQLLRDIASSSRDDVLRDKLIHEATKILMGDNFVPIEENFITD